MTSKHYKLFLLADSPERMNTMKNFNLKNTNVTEPAITEKFTIITDKGDVGYAKRPYDHAVLVCQQIVEEGESPYAAAINDNGDKVYEFTTADMFMMKLPNRIRNIMSHNGYTKTLGSTVLDSTYIDKDNKRTVTVIKQGNRVHVTISATFVHDNIQNVFSSNTTFYPPHEDTFDMYDEFGTPEDILCRMINNFNQTMYFMDALHNGKELCVYDKPSLPLFVSMNTPF